MWRDRPVEKSDTQPTAIIGSRHGDIEGGHGAAVIASACSGLRVESGGGPVREASQRLGDATIAGALGPADVERSHVGCPTDAHI
jgi:hypothetical protein